jgi:hypothetical protein
MGAIQTVDKEKSKQHFLTALSLTKSVADKQIN